MMPMAKRLYAAFDKACFDYSENELESDLNTIENAVEYIEVEPTKLQQETAVVKEKLSKGIKSVGAGISGFISKKTTPQQEEKEQDTYEDKIETVKKMKELLDIGAITQEEFDAKKKELLGL